MTSLKIKFRLAELNTSLNVHDLLRDDRKHLQNNAVELIKTSPCSAACDTFENLGSRFILVARAPSRIIDALRSRSRMIRIPATDREQIILTLSSLSEKSSTSVTPEVIEDIVCQTMSSRSSLRYYFLITRPPKSGRV